MTEHLPAPITALPPMTPFAGTRRTLHEIETQREAVFASVRVVVFASYYRERLAPAEQRAIEREWADSLEDWPAEDVHAALRHWRDENPDKRPNPGHIKRLLREAWGRKHAEQVRAAVAQSRPQVVPMTAEQHARVAADMGSMLDGFLKRMPEVKA